MGRLFAITKQNNILYNAEIVLVSQIFLHFGIDIVVVNVVACYTVCQHLWQTLENPLDEIIQAHSVVPVTVSQAQLAYEALNAVERSHRRSPALPVTAAATQLQQCAATTTVATINLRS